MPYRYSPRDARDPSIQPADSLRSHTRASSVGRLIRRDGSFGCRRGDLPVGFLTKRMHDLADIGLVAVLLAVVVELGAWLGGGR